MAEPIQPEMRQQMNAIAHALDEVFNGPKQPGVSPRVGFLLLTAEFGRIDDGRVNYISNGRRADMVAMLREVLARFEGRAHAAPGAPAMTAPRRIRLSRAKGWRKPEGAVVVARPTKWGNPFDYREAARVGYGDGRCAAVDAFRGWLRGEDWGVPKGQSRESMAASRQVILDSLPALRGRDLCCWCALDAPCHAGVLLEIANR